MTERDRTEVFDPRWLVVALRALLPARRRGSIQLEVEGASLRLSRSSMDIGDLDRPDAVVEGWAHELLGVVTGQLSLTRLTIHGDRGGRRGRAESLLTARQCAQRWPPRIRR